MSFVCYDTHFRPLSDCREIHSERYLRYVRLLYRNVSDEIMPYASKVYKQFPLKIMYFINVIKKSTDTDSERKS